MTTKPRDPTAARLCTAYGCSGCKHQQTDDEFLTLHSRWWCGKAKLSHAIEDRAADTCPHWTFNGSEDLLEALDQPKIPGVVVGKVVDGTDPAQVQGMMDEIKRKSQGVA